MPKIDSSQHASGQELSQLNKILRRNGLSFLVRCALAVVVINTSWSGSAQNFVESMDSSRLLAELMRNVGAAESAERTGYSQVTNLHHKAQAAAARLGQVSFSPEAAREERLNILRCQIEAAQIRLEIAKSNSILLQTATDLLQRIQAGLPKSNDNSAPAALQPGTLCMQDGQEGADLDAASSNTTILLQEAQKYYESASKLSIEPGMINEAMRGLAKWASNNRQAILQYDDKLRRLETALAAETADKLRSTQHEVYSNLSDNQLLPQQSSQPAWFLSPRMPRVIMVYPTRSGSTWFAYPSYRPVYGYYVQGGVAWPRTCVRTWYYQPEIVFRRAAPPFCSALIQPSAAPREVRRRRW